MIEDVLRFINAALCLAIVGGLLLDRHSAWRAKGPVIPSSQDRLTATALAMVFTWLGLASLDEARDDGPAVYRLLGFGLLLALTLLALIVKAVRARKVQRHMEPVMMRVIQDTPVRGDTPMPPTGA
jgi:hypothetical protein